MNEIIGYHFYICFFLMLISSSIVFRDIRYYLNLSMLLQVSWRVPFALLLLVFHIVHRVQNAICRIDYIKA